MVVVEYPWRYVGGGDADTVINLSVEKWNKVPTVKVPDVAGGRDFTDAEIVMVKVEHDLWWLLTKGGH